MLQSSPSSSQSRRLRRRRWCRGRGVGSTLRVTVLDQTEAALVIAQVTIVDSRGVEQTATVDDRGVAVFENLESRHLPGEGHGRQLPSDRDAVQRAPRREPHHAAAGPGDDRTDRRRPGPERRRSPRQRLHADADAGPDRFAAGRSGRNGRGADAHGRSRRADLRQRLPRRPTAAEGSDPADPLPHQLVLGGVSRGRHDPRRGDHQAGHGRLARHDQLRLPRRIAERDAGFRRRKGRRADAALHGQLPGPDREGQDRPDRVVRRQQLLRIAHHRRAVAERPVRSTAWPNGARQRDELQRARRAPDGRHQPAAAGVLAPRRTIATTSASAISICPSAPIRPTTAPTPSACARPA